MVETNEQTKEGPFPQYPEGSDAPVFGSILKKTNALSRRSRTRLPKLSGEGFIRGSDRPDALRRERRQLAEEVKTTPKSQRKSIIMDAHARDDLAEKFLHSQQEIRVDMGDLGEQMARFVVLTPPEGRKTEETDSKPPIFLISGISNDLENMGMLPQEIAFQGRKVVTIAYPESWQGNVTDEFRKKAEESSTLEPHVSFFKKAIELIRQNPVAKTKIGEHEKIELWGFSAGALMVSEMLTDESFNKNVSNAAIIAPASNSDRGTMSAYFDVFKDQMRTFFTDFKNTAKMNPSIRTKIKYNIVKTDRAHKTFQSLERKVLKKHNWWEQDMGVSEGGKIAVVSYESDFQAQTRRVESEIAQNPNIELIRLPGTHETAKIQSETLIKAINSSLNSLK